jgi:ATP-dependent protease ClpP protease subunit
MAIRKRLIQAKATAPKAGELLLYGDIGPSDWGMIDAKSVAEALAGLGDVSVINLRIDSAGGGAFDGVAIFNQLRRHPAAVHVSVDGLAASIASVIAMAGDTITMGEGAQMMIHDASSVAFGNAAEMRRTADVLDGISNDIAEIYARRTGRPVAEIRDLMLAETWLSAQAAVDAKLADSIVAGAAVTASLTDSEANRFKHPPKVLLSARGQHGASRVASMAARAAKYASAGV